MSYQFITAEVKGRVGLITLNRPKQMNALNATLMQELAAAMYGYDADDGVGCLVITGNDKAFAAGADIVAMKDFDFMQAFKSDYITRDWEHIRRIRKPIIAAESAKFGQPEINLGIFPGAGGTRRRPRAVGQAEAMDLVLTARMMDAAEAERAGLVSRVVPNDKLLEEAMAAAQKIGEYSLPVAMMAKEAVNRAYEANLTEGILFERRLFHSAFALEDQKEGMAAFAEKRKPSFRHR